MKTTPKSCSCYSCKRGKHSKHGHVLVNYDERACRREAKRTLDTAAKAAEYEELEDVSVSVAPKGNYYD